MRVPSIKAIAATILCVLLVISFARGFGADKTPAVEPDDAALLKSWTEFEAKLRPRPVFSDLLRTNSLKHPIVGIVEFQEEPKYLNLVKETYGNTTTQFPLRKIYGYRVRFVPVGGGWKFADGEQVLVWSNDRSDAIGRRIRLDDAGDLPLEMRDILKVHK